jgi:hypothetical protein
MEGIFGTTTSSFAPQSPEYIPSVPTVQVPLNTILPTTLVMQQQQLASVDSLFASLRNAHAATTDTAVSGSIVGALPDLTAPVPLPVHPQSGDTDMVYQGPQGLVPQHRHKEKSAAAAAANDDSDMYDPAAPQMDTTPDSTVYDVEKQVGEVAPDEYDPMQALSEYMQMKSNVPSAAATAAAASGNGVVYDPTNASSVMISLPAPVFGSNGDVPTAPKRAVPRREGAMDWDTANQRDEQKLLAQLRSQGSVFEFK